MLSQIRSAVVAVVIGTFCTVPGFARGDQPAGSVADALSQLEKWLGGSSYSQAWTSYLKLKELKQEIAKGAAADPAVISAVQAQLNSGAAGLDLAPFQTLRTALDTWAVDRHFAGTANLSEAILGSVSNYHRVTPEEVAAARKSLGDAMGKLDRYLTNAGATGTAWRKYLRWDDLKAQLQAETPDVAGLKAIRKVYAADFNGLELPVFANTGNALEVYNNRLEANRDETESQFAAQLKSLAEELAKYPENYNDELASTVGGRLGWLERMQQTPQVVRVVRDRYSAPNLYGKVSSRIVAAGIAQPVDDTAPIVDNIMGTSISGTGRTVGKLDVLLVPNSQKAVFETRLNGTTATRTVGYNGPATIHANGTTQISGSKRIEIDANGLTGRPAQANANTMTQITGIAAGGNIAQRIATNRVYESKAQAERIGSQHAAARIRSRVDSQAQGQLAKAQSEYLQKFRNPLVRVGEFPSQLQFSTTAEDLYVKALQGNRFQLGAPSQPPAVTIASDVAVQVHESTVNNFAAALLSGLTVHEEELQKKVIEWRGSLPDQLKTEEDRDPWSITFAKSRPVTLKVGEDGFQITVRGDRYTSGENVFPAMYVTANYKAEISGHGSKFIRQGDLQIDPPGFVSGRDRLSASQVSQRRLLQKRFGKLFEPEVVNDGLVLPGRWRDAGRLDLKQLQHSGGWLVMAWVASGEPAPPEERVAAGGK